MRHIQIKTYNPKQRHDHRSLFILSKGYNAGKPLDGPCPNCFVITTDSPEEKILLHWICYMLWQSGAFKRLLIGSVIQFIRLRESKDRIEQALNVADNSHVFMQVVNSLEKIASHRKSLCSQLDSLDELKKQLIRQTLRI